MWWLPIVEFFGQIALKMGLKWLQAKYPGLGPIMNQIIAWMEGQKASGNPKAAAVLSAHVNTLCQGVACASELKQN